MARAKKRQNPHIARLKNELEHVDHLRENWQERAETAERHTTALQRQIERLSAERDQAARELAKATAIPNMEALALTFTERGDLNGLDLAVLYRLLTILDSVMPERRRSILAMVDARFFDPPREAK